MLIVISVIHFIVSLILLIAVLATDSKAGLRSFSSSTSANESAFLKSSIDKFTVRFISILGCIFFCTSISMSYFSKIDGDKHNKRLIQDSKFESYVDKQEKIKEEKKIKEENK